MQNNPQTIEFKETMLNGRYNLKTSMSNKHMSNSRNNLKTIAVNHMSNVMLLRWLTWRWPIWFDDLMTMTKSKWRHFSLIRYEVKSSIDFLMSWHPSNIWRAGSRISLLFLLFIQMIIFDILINWNGTFGRRFRVKAFRLIPNAGAGKGEKHPNRSRLHLIILFSNSFCTF